MTGRLAAGLALGLVSSLALNAGYLLQHRASAGRPGFRARQPLASLRALAVRREWLGAIALSTAGWAIFVAALWLAPLSLVTAFLVGGLALVVPVASRLLGGRAGFAEKATTAVTAAALVLLAIGAGAEGPHRHYRVAALGLYGAAMLAVAAVAVAAAPSSRRTDALGFAAGALYGVVDVCTKGLTGVVSDHGLLAIFRSPLAYAFGALTIAAFLAFQRGLEGRRPVPAIALMTSANYVAAVIGGLAVFGDPLGSSGAWTAVHVAVLVLLAGMAFALASAEARLFADGREADGAQPPDAPAAAQLDLDGAWPSGVMGLEGVDLRRIGPRVRYCARESDLGELREHAGAALDARFALYGSGDFHHLTALRLARLTERVTVVAFDNHPDWDLRPPRWACGAWVCRALELVPVERVVVWGCGNFELRLPWRLFRSRSPRLQVVAWRERLDGGPFESMSRADWRERFERFAGSLAGRRVYVTVDLDALAPGEAVTNWESGAFSARDIAWALGRLRRAADVVGGDVCGAWSAPAYARRWQRLLAEHDHPGAGAPGGEAVNLRALQLIWPALTGEARQPPAGRRRPVSADSG